MLKKKFHLVTLVLLLVSMAAFPLSAASQAKVLTFFVTRVDKSQYPDIKFDMRAVDPDTGQVVTGLGKPNIIVYENGQPVQKYQLNQHTDGKINYIFVIDFGMLSHYADFGFGNVRDIFKTLINPKYFVDGFDTVQVLGQKNANSDLTIPLMKVTSRGSDLVDWVKGFPFQENVSARNTKGLQGIEDAIQTMSKQVTVPGSETAVIIFITRYIEDPETAQAQEVARNLAQEARQNYMSIYAFQTLVEPVNDRNFAQPLEVLTSGVNDGYTALKADTSTRDVESVYQTMQDQRSVYTVTYTSQLSTPGARQITINSPQAPVKGVAGSYEIPNNLPKMAIVLPVRDSTIPREPRYVQEKTWVYDAYHVPVTAEITWPDNVPHQNFQSAKLFVNNVLEDDVPQWNAGQSNVTFSWDISDIDNPGTNPIPLTIQVTDKQGVTIKADTTVNIFVKPIPETPSGLDGSWWIWALAGFSLFLILSVSGGLLIYSRRQPGKVSEKKIKAKEPASKTIVGGMPGLNESWAALTVLQGPAAMKGKKFSLLKPITVLGRNQTQADIAFVEDGESSVSRVHCTLTVNGDQYYLTDENSSNGTWINGSKLQPKRPVLLQNGDQVVLGQLTRRGVKLQFNRSLPNQVLQDSDKTNIPQSRT